MGRVRFSDVVKRVNVFVDREHTDLLYYVGGEHIDSDAFMVRKNGLIKGATIGYKFHFGFQPGHILFMSRNPHLRKCSMVDFAGVCSDSTYVVETRDENVLLQKYLLIEMQSDRFWKWAEENKSGSVNYLINYCTLDSYEFDLPPIEEQRAVAEKLWAANDLKEKYQHLLAATDEMLKAKFREMFGECGVQSAEGGVVSLKDVCAILTDGTHQPPKFCDSGIPFLFVSNIKDFELTYDTDKFVTKEQYVELNKRTPVAKGDVVLSVVGSFGNPALVKDDRPFCFQRHIAYLKPNREIVVPEYLYFVLLADSVQKQFGVVAKGCAQKTITLTDLKAITIPLPPLALQQQFVEIARKAGEMKAVLKKSITSIDAVIKGLING